MKNLLDVILSNSLYHISFQYFGLEKVFIPNVPKNYFTKHHNENNKIPRISFSTSIEGCLIGLSQNLENKILYVYTPAETTRFYKPSEIDVPDINASNEYWCLTTITCKLKYKIKILPSTFQGIQYKLGTTYGWNYQIIKKYY